MRVDVEKLKAKFPTLKDIQVYRGWAPDEPTFEAYGFNAWFTDKEEMLELLPSIDVKLIECAPEGEEYLTDEIAVYIEAALYEDDCRKGGKV